ncbi:MAG TPA: choice-of-anchor tandem repeat GloVer-containing protein [Rhizomicrobium sp.]|nr:choice-of-anchor tandem repeat GloVer-containing protein [Rhizomicrobium sp.]
MSVIRSVARTSMVSGGLILALAVPFQSAQAGKFQVLYAFQGGSDAANPFGAVIRNGGIRYGTTYYGGTNNDGAVFQLANDGTESVLYSFAGGTDGANPQTDLIKDSGGNLYGTTNAGGAKTCGTVFKVTPQGTKTTVVSFTCTDGAYPDAGVIADKEGNLFGTTYGGGAGNSGTVYKVTADGTESVVHDFSGGTDGAYPYGGLLAGKKGVLFGTTYGGGTAGVGTVFEVTAKEKESVLYAFKGGSDGAYPFANLIADSAGNLYGTTYYGGGTGCSGSGCGTVFKVAPGGTETVLHAFAGGNDGMGLQAGLVMDARGNLYGTTLYGGGSGCGGVGCGTVFKLAPDGTKTTLHAFSGSDGYGPAANMIADKKGNLYGTTFNGGGTGCGGDGCGVVFKLKE